MSALYLARFVFICKCHIVCQTTLLRRIKYGSCLKWLSLKLFDWICRVKFTNIYSQTKETSSAKLPATQESCTVFCSCPACQSFCRMAEHRFSRGTKTSFKPFSMARNWSEFQALKNMENFSVVKFIKVCKRHTKVAVLCKIVNIIISRLYDLMPLTKVWLICFSSCDHEGENCYTMWPVIKCPCIILQQRLGFPIYT